MRLVPIPDGWDELSRHLIEEHELDPRTVDAWDAETMRVAHAQRHKLSRWQQTGRERRHEHHG